MLVLEFGIMSDIFRNKLKPCGKNIIIIITLTHPEGTKGESQNPFSLLKQVGDNSVLFCLSAAYTYTYVRTYRNIHDDRD